MKRLDARAIERLARERGGTVRAVDRSALMPEPGSRSPRGGLAPGRHVLVIEGFIPYSLNRDMRGKIRRRCELERVTREVVAAEAHRQRIPIAESARSVRLHVTFPEGRSRPDPDNLGKLILDAIKNAGLLIDDSYEYARFDPPVYYLGSARTEIELTDIETRIVAPRSPRGDLNPEPMP